MNEGDLASIWRVSTAGNSPYLGRSSGATLIFRLMYLQDSSRWIFRLPYLIPQCAFPFRLCPPAGQSALVLQTSCKRPFLRLFLPPAPLRALSPLRVPTNLLLAASLERLECDPLHRSHPAMAGRGAVLKLYRFIALHALMGKS